MPTPVFCCGMECGTVSAHWTLTGAGVTFDTTRFNNGLRSIRCNLAGAAGSALSISELNITIIAPSVLVMRAYIFISTAPTSSTNPIIVGLHSITAGVPDHGLVYDVTALNYFLGPAESASAGSTITISTGVWHRIDLRVDGTANPWLLDGQVDGVAFTQRSISRAATTFDNVRCGSSSGTPTYDIYHDDILMSGISADYPLGDGKVLSFVPNADGTHTSTNSDIVEGTIATPVGADITVATTDAFNWVNARPILGGATDNTRLINHRLAAVTEYAEVDFEPTAEASAPRAVEVLTVDRQAATQVGVFSTKLNDNGTENVIINRTGAGVVTDRYVTKQYATMVGGGAWTLARFNALKARFGYSSDATPDQYWRGIMIEAEFAVVLPPGLGPAQGELTERQQSASIWFNY